VTKKEADDDRIRIAIRERIKDEIKIASFVGK
jgi:hypothetical protein